MKKNQSQQHQNTVRGWRVADASQDPSFVGMTQRQAGMSLIELMVTLVISSMILAGVMQLFVSSKHTYSTEEALSRMQENARFAEKKISKDIRVTGFSGCTGSSSRSMSPNVVAKPSGPVDSFKAGISVFGKDSVTVNGSSDDSVEIGGVTLDYVKAGTDVLSVSTAGGCGAPVVLDMPDRSSDVEVSDADQCNWNANDYLMITNCIAMDVFRLSADPISINNSELLPHKLDNNSDSKFSTRYRTDSMVYGFDNTIWYVRQAQGDSAAGLYKTVNDGTPELMVEGLEDMQIRYGYDNDGDYIIDELRVAKQLSGAADWQKVISIEVSLLLASEGNLLTSPQDYRFWVDDSTSGSMQTVTADDKKIYYVFTRNVTMRNLSL